MKWTVLKSNESYKDMKIELPAHIICQQEFTAIVAGKSLQCQWDRAQNLLSVDFNGYIKQYRVRSSQVQKKSNSDVAVSLEFISPEQSLAQNLEILVGLDSPGREQRQNIASQSGFSLKSPMSGKVLDVHVKVGEKVLPGQTIMVIEAMKMENAIVSEHEGIIEVIHVEKNSVVAAGQLLIKAKSVTL